MDDSDNMSTDDGNGVDSAGSIKIKPKKRSLVERELETNLTARVTSPVANADSTSLSRYGRARRLKTEMDSDVKKGESPKLHGTEKSPMRVQSPVYKMHASNTPLKTESPKKLSEPCLDNPIEKIYHENISLSRFATEEVVTSPVKNIPKLYIRKDMIQRKDTEETIMLIKNIFSPEKDDNKTSHLGNILEHSERFNTNSKQNGFSLDNSSVVKTLDFDSKKKKKENKEKALSKNELFELEAKCMYQVGNLAWARVGTYPFWPCIITREPYSDMFVKKKLFGRVEHYIIHVTFFGDNGRRSWIVDNMLRNYTGITEFESTREHFTAEDKKRDPRLYAAFFVSEKKQALWRMSVNEAETLYKEPKRLRIDLFNDMLQTSRILKTPKVQKKITRTDSDVSLSESLYDSLFSEDDVKTDDTERLKNKSRNKSLDVSEVVTACLDNMAAKTGITKIQKQSHMDRWLQKAKSKTPEKVQVKTHVVKVVKLTNNKKFKIIPRDMVKPYSLRRSGNESQTLLFNQNEHDYSKVFPEIFKDEEKKDAGRIESNSDLVNFEPSKKLEKSDCSFSESLIDTESIDFKDIKKSPICLNEEGKSSDTQNNIRRSKVIIIQTRSQSKIQKDNENLEVESGASCDVTNTSTLSSNSAQALLIDSCKKMETHENYLEAKNCNAEDKESTVKVIEHYENKDKNLESISFNITTNITAVNLLEPEIKLKSIDNIPSKEETADVVNDNNTQSIITKINEEFQVNNGTVTTNETEKTVERTSDNEDSEINSKPIDTTNNSDDMYSKDTKCSNIIVNEDNINLQDPNISAISEIINLNNETSNMYKIDGSFNNTLIFDNSQGGDITTRTDTIVNINPTENVSKNKTECSLKNVNKTKICSDETLATNFQHNIATTSNKTNLHDKTVSIGLAIKENSEDVNQMDVDLEDTFTCGMSDTTLQCFGDASENERSAETSQTNLTDVNKDKEKSIGRNLLLKNTDLNIQTVCEDIRPEETHSNQDTLFNIKKNEIFCPKDNCEEIGVINYLDCMKTDINEGKNIPNMDNNSEAPGTEASKNRSECEIAKSSENANTINRDSPTSSQNVKNGIDLCQTGRLADVRNKDFKVYNFTTKDSKCAKLCKPTKNLFKESTEPQVDKCNELKFPNEFNMTIDNPENIFKSSKMLDSVDIEKTTEASSNIGLENNSKIIEDNLRSTKTKPDHFIFLDKSTVKSIDLTEKANGDIDDQMTKGTFNIQNYKFDDSSDCKIYSSKVNGDLEIEKLNEKLHEVPIDSFVGRIVYNKEYNDSVSCNENNNVKINDDNLLRCTDKNSPCKVTSTTTINSVKIKKRNMRKTKDETKSITSKSHSADLNSAATKNNTELIDTNHNVQNDSENTVCEIYANDNSKANNEILHNVLSYQALNELETIRNPNSQEIPNPFLNFSASENINHSPNTRNFLDSINSLEIAIRDDIAKLDMPFEENEKASLTLNNCEILENVSEIKIHKESGEITKNKCENQHIDEHIEDMTQNNSLKENAQMTDNTKNIYETGESEINSESIKSNKHQDDYTVTSKNTKSDSKIKCNKENVFEPNINTLEVNISSSELNIDDNLKKMDCGNCNVERENVGMKCHIKVDNVKSLHNTDKDIDAVVSSDMKQDAPQSVQTLVTKSNKSKPTLRNKFLNNVKETHYIENGYHDSDSPDVKDSDDDFNIDTISLNSEDSVVSFNKLDKYYKNKLRTKPGNPLENPEFLKYLELRQDSVIDENPGLTDDEIISYLYKTYLYEESQKSDIRKTDDIQQSNIVKGLQDRVVKKNRVSRSVRDSLFKKKKSKIIKEEYYEDSDTVSATSDSDVSWNSKPVSKSNLVVKLLDKVNSKGDKIMKIMKVEKDLLNTEHNIEIKLEDEQTSLVNKGEKLIKQEKVSKVGESEDMECNSSDIEKTYDSVTSTIIADETDVPLSLRKKRSKVKENSSEPINVPVVIKEEFDYVPIEFERSDVSIEFERCDVPLAKTKKTKNDRKNNDCMANPEFIQYLELRQDSLIDENPQLSHEEIVSYLYKTWLYEEGKKSDLKKTDEIAQSTLVKGLNQVVEKKQKIKKKIKIERDDDSDETPRDKPKRKAVKPFYNEEYSDLEEELEVFEIFKPKIRAPATLKDVSNKTDEIINIEVEPLHPEGDVQTENDDWEDVYDGVELYFEQLTQPKPNLFKGLVRERVCQICETVGNLMKCKSCHDMFHVDCERKVKIEIVEENTPMRGRKKKKSKQTGRKTKGLDDSESQSDEKCLDISEEQIISLDDNETESQAIDADLFEQQLSTKMKEMLDYVETINYDSYSSDDGINWNGTEPGKCEIVDVKLKRRSKPLDCSDYKCNNCQQQDTPICSVCKSSKSKTGNEFRQKCNVAHCHKYYHLECLDHWPQAHFNPGEPSKSKKQINKHFESLTCPRHVCHTCVSDDPRGCKTRFSGDKLARCVRCPATYHSFTKCIPAGTKILTGSQIICPRHYEHRPGKVPCHVNTGWCFICALGGTLICCEYCPTSFHAECLNINPPEGGYMCEDCETGRLPLYGEMVWVKLGHYRWWPGIILHPVEIPSNLLAVKHSFGEFVVRFFGQYDHYWVNRGRVFPFQEGDSGRVSSQKSKIDAAFTMAMEHAQRACGILKNAVPNEEESMDIASSLLPPLYVKLKTNKPIGSVCLKKLDDPELSLTQCECDPNEEDPCGPYSQCLNRMLLTECGPTCRSGDRCNNRAFEKRLYPKLTPYRTGGSCMGWGLKTLEDIKAGQFVIEYVGELIDEEEFQRRMRRKHEIRDENYYFLTLDKERMIDAGPKGNLARFMNHCCEPNCETQKWTVLGDIRVGLFALHDIPANTEVTFNYNLECAGIEKKRCLCGTKRCSGYMGAKPKQDETQKKKLQTKRTYKKRKPIEKSPDSGKKQKRPLGRPKKNREPPELTEIEKDLLIIKSATNLSSDDSDFVDKPKSLKRKRVSFSSEEVSFVNGAEASCSKRSKIDVGD